MRVFITGGTGLVGSAVVAELISHGHSVIGLARSDTSARVLKQAGADELRGELSDLDVLRAGASQADGVIHLAFNHSIAGPEALRHSITEESSAIAALGEVLIGSNRPIVTVSGTPLIPGRASVESDPAVTEGPVGGRGRAVTALLELASRGVRSAAVRLPRTVHNNGSGGFAGLLTGIARRSGIAGYPGDGHQRWPAVHALDAAILFRLALEQAEPGSSWHAVAEEGVAVRDIATVIGQRLNLPVQAIPADSFGPFASIFLADQPSSSAYTQQVLSWTPSRPGLLADLAAIEP